MSNVSAAAASHSGRARRGSAPSVAPCSLDEQQMVAFLRANCGTLEPVLTSLLDLRQPVNRSMLDSLGRLIQTAQDPLQMAFVSRSCNLLARMVDHLSKDALGEATGASSDLSVFVRALEDPSVMVALQEDEPLAKHRARGVESRERILRAEGGILNAREVADRLGISRQAVEKRRNAGKLLAVTLRGSLVGYPAWQFTDDGVLSGLDEVLSEFHDVSSWTQLVFFLSENSLLDGRRPLDELRKGNIEGVRRAAGALGEQGAA